MVKYVPAHVKTIVQILVYSLFVEEIGKMIFKSLLILFRYFCAELIVGGILIKSKHLMKPNTSSSMCLLTPVDMQYEFDLAFIESTATMIEREEMTISETSLINCICRTKSSFAYGKILK